MFFIFAWVKESQDDASFEEHVPLLFLGRSLKRHGSKESFSIIFLDGYERLSDRYLSQLTALGFNVMDFSEECRRLAGAFGNLQRFGKFEMLCFLRWLILARYVRLENIREPVIHIDGDLVFNASPAEIANDLEGLTFVLQGCPALTIITNHDWFEYYHEELVKLNRDIEGYSSRAWSERGGWEKSAMEKWAGSRHRRIVWSDQDLLSHLIHTDRIIQDNPLHFVKRLGLYYTENPLYFHACAKIQLSKETGLFFSSDGESCYVDEKKIAFWHFQSDFSRYVSMVAILHNMRYPFRAPNHLERRGMMDNILLYACRNGRRMGRREMYECLKELSPHKPDASMSFLDIFNRRSYWKGGVFRNYGSCWSPGWGLGRRHVDS